MEKFEVHFLGCGSALPTLKHYNSSQVINIREKLFMIDCGEGTQRQIRKSHLRFGRLNHIFISHLHGDHVFGLIGLISTFGMLMRTAQLHIYAPAPFEQIMRPQLDFYCSQLPFEVCFHLIDPSVHSCIYDDVSVSVWTLPLSHSVPCCGFLFREKAELPNIKKDMIDFYKIPHFDIPAIKQGADFILPDGTIVPNDRLVKPAPPSRSYAYCSDTMFKPSICEYIQHVDLLYHEATFAEADRPRAKKTMHSTAIDAAKMAELCQAKNLVLGHFSARYNDENCLLQEARQIFPNTILAEDGLCLSV